MFLILEEFLKFFIDFCRNRKINRILLFNVLFIIFFVFLSAFFNNVIFIECKISLIYLICSFILIHNYFFKKQYIFKILFKNYFFLSERVWKKLSLIWIFFLIFCSLLNLYVVFFYSQFDWVKFKVFGLTGLNLLFLLFNIFYVYKKIDKK